MASLGSGAVRLDDLSGEARGSTTYVVGPVRGLVGRHLALIGPPGVGKTTLGLRLGQRLGRPVVDTDAEVARRAGRPIPEIFRTQGEEAFRTLETDVLTETLARSEPVVVASGGGAVLAPASRVALAERSCVVWLRAPVPVLEERLRASADRPLLEGSGVARSAALARLLADRNPLYERLAEVVVDSTGDDPDGTAVALLRAVETAVRLRRVRLRTGSGESEVVIGPGARRALPDLLPEAAGRVVVVQARHLPWEVDVGRASDLVRIADGERAKTVAEAERLCRTFARLGIGRRDVVVSVGGGSVSDLVGFAAAIYHRGIPVVHVSTTLLGQVDAAIGGKCGVNLPEGKNLVGAFWQPVGVVADTQMLATLDEREWRSGRGELAKYAFLGEADLARRPLVDQIEAAVRHKVAVVEADERETGRRALLNYGHTLAHALEAVALEDGYDLRHGEAVAVGLVFAARLAADLGRVPAGRVQDHLEVLRAFGLPVRPPFSVTPERLVSFMARDKKARGALSFVLDGPGGLEVVHGVDPEVVGRLVASGWPDDPD